MNLAQQIVVTIRDSDISAVYIAGPRGIRPRTVLVRFSSREATFELLQKKKKTLKDVYELRYNFIGDDHTTLKVKTI